MTTRERGLNAESKGDVNTWKGLWAQSRNLVRDGDSVTLTECLNHSLRFGAPNLLFSLVLITNQDILVSWQHTNTKQKKKSLAVMILKGHWRFLSWRYLDEFSNQWSGLHELPKVLRRAVQKPRLLANFSKHEKDTLLLLETEHSVLLLGLSESVLINSYIYNNAVLNGGQFIP